MRQQPDPPRSLAEVATTLKRALYGRSPMVRAQAEADLIGWGLSAEPSALVLAARREQAETFADVAD